MHTAGDYQLLCKRDRERDIKFRTFMEEQGMLVAETKYACP